MRRPGRIERDGVGKRQLARPAAQPADLLQVVAVLVEPDQPGVPVAVRDHDAAVGEEGDAGGPVEVPGVVAEHPVLAQSHDRIAVGGELHDLVPLAVDDPDETPGVDVHRVRSDELLLVGERAEEPPRAVPPGNRALALVAAHRQGMRGPVVDVAGDRVDDPVATHRDAGAHLEHHVAGVPRPALIEGMALGRRDRRPAPRRPDHHGGDEHRQPGSISHHDASPTAPARQSSPAAQAPTRPPCGTCATACRSACRRSTRPRIRVDRWCPRGQWHPRRGQS